MEGLELNGELEPGDIASNMGVGDEVDRGQGPQDEYSVQLFSQQDFVFLFIGLVTPGPSNAIVGTGLPLTPLNVTSFTDVDLSISLAPPYEGAAGARGCDGSGGEPTTTPGVASA